MKAEGLTCSDLSANVSLGWRIRSAVKDIALAKLTGVSGI